MTMMDSTVRTYSVNDPIPGELRAPSVDDWCGESVGAGYICSMRKGHNGPQHLAWTQGGTYIMAVIDRDTSADAPPTPLLTRYVVGDTVPLDLRGDLGNFCNADTGDGWVCSLKPGHDGPQHLTTNARDGRVIAAADTEAIVERPTPEVLAERLAIATRELAAAVEVNDNLDRQLREARDEVVELRNTHDELRKRVVKTARRLAREHDWCSVVDAGLREMGLDDVTYEQRWQVQTDVWIRHGSWDARQESITVTVTSERGGADAWRDVDNADEETAIDMLNAAGIYLPDGWEFARFDASTGYADLADD